MENISANRMLTGRSCVQIKSLAMTAAQSKSSLRSTPSTVSPTLSMLSRHLGESSVRADARDKSLTRAELKVEGRRLIAQIAGDDYEAKKQLHNKERPKSQDPQLLERALRATEYIAKSDQLDRNVKNPFLGLPRDQLDLIVYDESGSYTVNERRAAYYGVLDMESQWNRQVMRIYDIEGAAGASNRPRFCTEVLAHYRTLPAIERAEYSDDYESRLEAQINEKPKKAKELDEPFTLFDLLARNWRLKKRSEHGPDCVGIGNSPMGTVSHQLSLTKNN